MIVWTRRCCAPSWRSRTTRRRSASAAATMRAREAARSVARLHVGDRRADQLGELRDPRLGRGGQRVAVRGADGDRAPEPPLDDDGRADRARQAAGARILRHRAGRRRVVVVDARRALGAADERGDVDPVQGQPVADEAAPGLRPQSATTVPVSSSSKRIRRPSSTSRIPATSSATAANTSVADASRATSVATRRRAACSSASRPTSRARLERSRSRWRGARRTRPAAPRSRRASASVLARRRQHHAPEPAVDEDRAPDGAADADGRARGRRCRPTHPYSRRSAPAVPCGIRAR